MKKLMILAVAMIAMAMGGKAEAALRLVVNYDGSDHVYYVPTGLNKPVVFDFSTPQSVNIRATVDTLSTNYPGENSQGGLLSQVLSLQVTNASNQDRILATLTVTLSVIADDLLGPGVYSTFDMGKLAYLPLSNADGGTIKTKPMVEFAIPTGQVAFTSQLQSSTTGSNFYGPGAGKQVTGYSTIYWDDFASNDMYLNNAGQGILATGLEIDPNIIPVPPQNYDIGMGYGISNTIVVSNWGVKRQSTANTKITLETTVVGVASVVPEPTSLALAGFAGIGMAVGAIRRRRQAKQAA